MLLKALFLNELKNMMKKCQYKNNTNKIYKSDSLHEIRRLNQILKEKEKEI